MTARRLRLRNHSFELGTRTLIMGILNVTPDSFSGDGVYKDSVGAVSRAKRMVEDGADIIDVGGESSRPGSDPVSAEEELRRLIPVVEALVAQRIPLSVDTHKPEVARRVLEVGADVINDITGLRNPRMAEEVADYGAGVVIMHMKGEPKTMQIDPTYASVVREVKDFLGSQISAAEDAGISEDSIVVDPGIGFGKTVEHNLEILARLRSLSELGMPILVGPSRKSFIGKLLDLPVDQRLEGSIAAVAASVMNGADIVRVHEVRECRRAIKIIDSISRTPRGE